jgi:hypothetical protein
VKSGHVFTEITPAEWSILLGLAAHHVRDEGVAGSNPAAPTNTSPNTSTSSSHRAQLTQSVPGQLLGQKRRSRQPPPSNPNPENESTGAATVSLAALTVDAGQNLVGTSVERDSQHLAITDTGKIIGSRTSRSAEVQHMRG